MCMHIMFTKWIRILCSLSVNVDFYIVAICLCKYGAHSVSLTPFVSKNTVGVAIQKKRDLFIMHEKQFSVTASWH